MLSGNTRLRNINHITYNVKNKDDALKWYQEVLGLKQIPKMVNSDHLYWLQLPSGAMVHIIENPDAPSAPSHHTAFEVEDIDAAHTQLEGWGSSAPRSRSATTGSGPSTSTTPTATGSKSAPTQVRVLVGRAGLIRLAANARTSTSKTRWVDINLMTGQDATRGIKGKGPAPSSFHPRRDSRPYAGAGSARE